MPHRRISVDSRWWIISLSFRSFKIRTIGDVFYLHLFTRSIRSSNSIETESFLPFLLPSSPLFEGNNSDAAPLASNQFANQSGSGGEKKRKKVGEKVERGRQAGYGSRHRKVWFSIFMNDAELKSKKKKKKRKKRKKEARVSGGGGGGGTDERGQED